MVNSLFFTGFSHIHNQMWLKPTGKVAFFRWLKPNGNEITFYAIALLKPRMHESFLNGHSSICFLFVHSWLACSKVWEALSFHVHPESRVKFFLKIKSQKKVTLHDMSTWAALIIVYFGFFFPSSSCPSTYQNRKP